MDLTAVIPVREGSRRVKDKNIRLFANRSLLEIKIDQLKRLQEVKEIVVSSDSEKMLSIAEKMGVTAERRPVEYCDETSKSFNEVVAFIAENQIHTDNILWAPCVCPLVKDDNIKKGIDIFKGILEGHIDADSVVSAKLIKEYIYDNNGPVNFSIEDHVPSQNLPSWHIIVNGFFIARRKDMIDWRFVYGKKPYLFEINKVEAIDIDDESDFRIAEMFMTGE